MVALVAILALPAFAFAAGTFSGEYPAAGATIATPAVIAVDLVGAPALKAATAKITVNGVAYPTLVTQASAGLGHWTSTSVLQANGSYKITWVWVGGASANATLYCYPPSSALTNGVKAIVASVSDVGNVVHTDSWSFTIALPVITIPPAAAKLENSQVCEVCHAGLATAVEMGPNCLECHDGNYLSPSHSTITSSSVSAAPGATIADGHKINGTLLGPKTKFDGSQGVTLQWESEIASGTLNSAYATALGVTSLTTGQVGTVNTNWTFPGQSVFWSSSDASAPATAIKGLTSASVIGCTDCHSSAGITYGPHGAISWGMDPNYPGDYSYAELTKYVTANLAYPTTNSNYNTPLSYSGIAMFPGAATHADITSASVASTIGLPAGTTALGNRTDGTTGATAVICAKCHQLEVFISAANGGANAVEGANTAHGLGPLHENGNGTQIDRKIELSFVEIRM
jgi:hypothetical protein